MTPEAPAAGRALCGLGGVAALAVAVLIAVEWAGAVAFFVAVYALAAVPPLALALRRRPRRAFRRWSGGLGALYLAVGVLTVFFGGVGVALAGLLMLLGAAFPAPDAPLGARVAMGIVLAALILTAWAVFAG